MQNQEVRQRCNIAGIVQSVSKVLEGKWPCKSSCRILRKTRPYAHTQPGALHDDHRSDSLLGYIFHKMEITGIGKKKKKTICLNTTSDSSVGIVYGTMVTV